MCSLFRLFSQLSLRFFLFSIFSLSCFGLSACSSFPPRIYRIDVQQGNHITPEMVSKLHRGMTREQVKDIMGTPALLHTLNTDRWDYYFSFRPGMGGKTQKKHVSVFFSGDKVTNITSKLD